MSRLAILAALAVLSLPVAAIAQDSSDEVLAERRLRACLMSGSAGAPRDSLLAAVIAVRSVCRPQIGQLLELKLREVDAGFGLPDTPLPTSQRPKLQQARDTATRLLNDEVVVAVSNFTGLTQ